MNFCVLLAILPFILNIFGRAQETSFEENINFIVYNSQDQVLNWTYQTTDLESGNCSKEEPLSFIVPGWKENCNTSEWIPVLVENLKKYRGGCIVCMDYFYYSKNPDYFGLLINFDDIYKVLLKEYLAFEEFGHKAENVFFYGFSFGAQLALDLGREINILHNGTNLISRMDVCEPTGVGFLNMKDSKSAANNVQCIHTNSLGYGTFKRDCHQDWNLGQCGNYQLANGPYPKGSHGLCPYFYNSAFENNFYAIPKEDICIARNEVHEWPEGFKMGYNENRFQNFTGELFAATTKDHPYNRDDSKNEIKQRINEITNSFKKLVKEKFNHLV